jgi:hypothetical protein
MTRVIRCHNVALWHKRKKITNLQIDNWNRCDTFWHIDTSVTLKLLESNGPSKDSRRHSRDNYLLLLVVVNRAICGFCFKAFKKKVKKMPANTGFSTRRAFLAAGIINSGLFLGRLAGGFLIRPIIKIWPFSCLLQDNLSRLIFVGPYCPFSGWFVKSILAILVISSFPAFSGWLKKQF